MTSVDLQANQPVHVKVGKAGLARVAQWQRRLPVVQLAALVGVYIYGAVSLPGLATWESTRILLLLAALAGLAGLGQTFLILMGGFDLSIAGFIFASGLIVTDVRSQWGVSFFVAFLVALAGAAILGALTGQICHRLDVNPLIVTLATGTIAFGLAQSQTAQGLAYGAGAPTWLVRLCSPLTHTFGLPIPPLVSIWFVLTVVMTIFIHRTVPGRRLLATGANSRAADLALIRTTRVWTLTFMGSAIASVFLGLAVTGFGGSITTTAGNPYMFQSVVVVILGGTVFGGPGDYFRTGVGALFVTILSAVLVGHGATSGEQQMIYAASIIAVLSFYGRQNRVRDRV